MSGPQKDSTLPIDPNIKVPDSVRRAAAKAESYYVKPVDPPAALEPVQPAITAPPEPVQTAPQATPEPVQTAPQATPEPVQPAPQATPEPPNFEHMYNSMKGRWESASRTIGSMQEQMQQLGDELLRTQAVMANPINHSSNLPAHIRPEFVTDEDVKNYGTDLIDLTKRAALEAVAPTLQELQRENIQLRQAVTQQRTETIYERLDEGLPNWREINQNPRWLAWLRLRDFNSAPIRQEQLNRSMQAADAPRVIWFFQRFLNEEVATGQMPAPQSPQPQTNEPRPNAVSLTTLAAPGRPNPASGQTQVPDAQPVITHKQIAAFYDDVRKGVYAGRDADKARDEQMIFSAQRDGRIR